jgi:hypothetical protein
MPIMLIEIQGQACGMRIKYLFATVLNDNPITCPRELATIFILMINTMENLFIVLSIED